LSYLFRFYIGEEDTFNLKKKSTQTYFTSFYFSWYIG